MITLDPIHPFPQTPDAQLPTPIKEAIKTEQIYKQLCQQFWGGDIQPLDESWQKRFRVYQAWSHANCQKEQFENKVAPGAHSSWVMENGELLLIDKKDDAFEIVNWHTGELTTIDKKNFRPALCATAINATYFICRNQTEIAFFNRQSGQFIDTLVHRSHSPFLLACNDHFLASVNEDKDSVTIWDVQTRLPYWSVEAVFTKPIWMLKLSGKYLAIEYEGCQAIYIADLEQKCVRKIEHGFRGFFPVEFRIHSDQLAAVEDSSGKIKVWDLKHLEVSCQEFEGISPLPGCESYKHMGAMCHPMDAFLVTGGYFHGPDNKGHSIFEVIDMRTKQIILKQKIEADILNIFVQDSQVTIVFGKGITIYNFEKLHTHFYLADCLKDETLGGTTNLPNTPEVATPITPARPATPPIALEENREVEEKETEEVEEEFEKIERPIERFEWVDSEEKAILEIPIKTFTTAPKQTSLWHRIYKVAQQILMSSIHHLQSLSLWTWTFLQHGIKRVESRVDRMDR